MSVIKRYAFFFAFSSVSVHTSSLPYMEHHFNFAAEAVIMNRNPAKKRCLAIDPDKMRHCGKCDDFCGLTTRSLRFDYDPGYRLRLFASKNAQRSFEAVFLWIQPWEAETDKKGDLDLSFPFHHGVTGVDYVDASRVSAKYNSCFWNAEVNYWHHFSPRHVDFFSLSGLLGLRYFHLNERFRLVYVIPPDKSHYRIRTDNDVGGAQIGLNLQMAPTRRVSWDFTGKVGIMVNRGTVKSAMLDENDTTLIGALSKERYQIGFFSELLGQFAYQFAKHLDAHVGVDFIYLSGVALAPEQVNRNLAPARRRIYTHGGIYIYGFYGGFTLGF